MTLIVTTRRGKQTKWVQSQTVTTIWTSQFVSLALTFMSVPASHLTELKVDLKARFVFGLQEQTVVPVCYPGSGCSHWDAAVLFGF